MRRRGLTLIELLITTAITALTVGAVTSTMNAFSGAMQDHDAAADGTARIARADVRLAEHLERARMILAQDADEVVLWLPTEPFTSSAGNTTDYDTIHANELAWYVMDAATGTLRLHYLANRADRSTHALSTAWTSLRPILASQGKLATVQVLEGLASGQFQIEDADACSVRRITFMGALKPSHGGMGVRLGGRLSNGQRHPDCP